MKSKLHCEFKGKLVTASVNTFSDPRLGVRPGDAEEGVAVSLAVPSTSPPTNTSPSGAIKEAATPPSSPSMGSVLTVQG